MEITTSQFYEMNIAERLNLAKTRTPVQRDVYQLLAQNCEQRRARSEVIETYRNCKGVVYYANGEVDVHGNSKPITMSQIEKMDVEQLAQLTEKHVRVSALVYMILDREEKNCVSRKEIVRKYGTGSEVEYYSDGQVRAQGVIISSLLKPGISPLPPPPKKE